MRDSLVSLRSSYINDRTSQQAQQQTINEQIAELQNLGGLEGELQGFLLAKAYIDAQVENTNNIINQLAAQIGVLNQQIEELQSGIGG
jgi:prefoldin subunit 5